MNHQHELFDPSITVPTACPVGWCPAIRLPTQTTVPTCVHDLDREGPRPRGCLNAHDPATAPFPEGF